MTNMTDLKTALRDALGVNGPTQMETLWRAVKDMQPVGYHALAKRTGIPLSSVSSIMCVMEKRNMVYSRGGPGKGPTGRSKEYLTDLTEYKRLPLPDVSGTVTKPKVVVSLTPPAVSNALDAQKRVDALTVAQARELWTILDRMFGRNA